MEPSRINGGNSRVRMLACTIFHLPLLLARMASIMVKRVSRAPPGILDEILRWATHEGKVCATAFISSCRMLAGVSHFVATSMVGREELAREAAAQACIVRQVSLGDALGRRGKLEKLTHGWGEIMDAVRVGDVVQNQGAVHAGDHMAVYLFGPLYRLARVKVFEAVKVQFYEGNEVSGAVDFHAQSRDV